MTDKKGKPGSFQKRKGRKLICNLRVQRVFSSVRRCLLRRAGCPPPFPYPCVAGGAAIALPTSASFRAFFQLRVDCICDQQKKRGKEAIKRRRSYSFFFLFSFSRTSLYSCVNALSPPCYLPLCMSPTLFARNTHTDEEVRTQAYIAGVTAALNRHIHTLATNDKAHMKVRKKRGQNPFAFLIIQGENDQ